MAWCDITTAVACHIANDTVPVAAGTQTLYKAAKNHWPKIPAAESQLFFAREAVSEDGRSQFCSVFNNIQGRSLCAHNMLLVQSLIEVFHVLNVIRFKFYWIKVLNFKMPSALGFYLQIWPVYEPFFLEHHVLTIQQCLLSFIPLWHFAQQEVFRYAL